MIPKEICLTKVDTRRAALWFSVAKPAEGDCPAAVSVLATSDDIVLKEDAAIQLPETRLFQPRHVARRITAQSGWFTIHKTDDTGAFGPLHEEEGYTTRLSCIRVPANQFSTIRWNLDRCGVNEASLFGDLAALCSHLGWLHSLASDEIE